MTEVTEKTDPTAEFAAYMLQDTSAVEIDLPNGEPMMYPPGSKNRVVVHVYCPSTRQFLDAQDALQRYTTSNLKVDKRGGVKTKGKVEDNLEADARFLTAITHRVDNFPFPGGTFAMYSHPGLKYIEEQVRSQLASLGNFFPTPPQS